jgi:hypothetical protein
MKVSTGCEFEIPCGLRYQKESGPRLREPGLITYSYKEFKSLPLAEINIGMRIGPLDPSKLFASQDWITMEKLKIALASFLELQELQKQAILVIPVYTYDRLFPDGTSHRRIVIADCHHRTLVWDLNDLKIDGEVQMTSLPKHIDKKNIIPYSRFRRLHAPDVPMN